MLPTGELPRLPVSLLPKVWGVEQTLRDLYVTVSDGACVIGAEKSLQVGSLSAPGTFHSHCRARDIGGAKFCMFIFAFV